MTAPLRSDAWYAGQDRNAVTSTGRGWYFLVGSTGDQVSRESH